MIPSPSIYLASPLGFVPYGARYARELVDLVTAKHARALDPWDTPEGERLAQLVTGGAPLDELAAANREVAAANQAMLRACDGVLACLDGTTIDDGTASEIGYAAGIGRIITGFRSDLRQSGDNLGTPINLQVAYFIEVSGGAIFKTADSALDYLIALLSQASGDNHEH